MSQEITDAMLDEEIERMAEEAWLKFSSQPVDPNANQMFDTPTALYVLRYARDKWLAPSPWISVSDRLPPIHEEPFLESRFVLILLQCKGWKPDTWRTMKASRAIGEWDENGDPLWFWFDEDGEIIDDDDNLITHWMEIPSPLYPTKS